MSSEMCGVGGAYLAGPGDGVLLLPLEGEGEGERRRAETLEGEDGRFQPGEEKRFSFSGFCERGGVRREMSER